jgi:hypothetical protein
MLPPFLRAVFCILFLLAVPTALRAQVTLSPPEAEAQKTEERIASVQREILGRYEDALSELQLTLQKAADLEGALTVRAERDRLKAQHALTEANYLNEPKALRTLQMQTVAKMRELVTQLLQEALPRLIEFKKNLTVAGKLDEAVAVRTAIERLQNAHLPVTRIEAGSVVLAETLLLDYAGDRGRADKIYKGQKLTVRGILGGYRQDPADSRNFQLFLAGSTGTGWIYGAFSTAEYRVREEKGPFGAVSFVVSTKDGENSVRLQKGQIVEIRGECAGFDEVVRLERCGLPR